jgi:hypothetical protein
MKKFFTLIALFLFVTSHAQSYYKGALIVDAGGGLEFYNTKVFIHNKTTNKDTTETDFAANSHYTFGAEYAIGKTYGIGLRFKGNKFFTEKDTVNNTQPTLKSNDIVVQFNYHFLVNKVFDLSVGADFGYSGMKWDLKDKEGNKITAAGTYFSFYALPRVYIGPFGFYMKLGAPYFSYPSLKSNNPDFTRDYDYKLKGSPGFNFELGIQFRFVEDKDKDSSKN